LADRHAHDERASVKAELRIRFKDIDWLVESAQGVTSHCFKHSTRRFPMKRFMLCVTAVMCLAGFSSLSFADEMGKMKDEMKGEMKGEKDKMKGEMKGKMGEMGK
jgi:hypothetical protein